eukprot:COSAG02_NODE_7414_length_3025_cov_59.395967_5_plen_115_part_00
MNIKRRHIWDRRCVDDASHVLVSQSIEDGDDNYNKLNAPTVCFRCRQTTAYCSWLAVLAQLDLTHDDGSRTHATIKLTATIIRGQRSLTKRANMQSVDNMMDSRAALGRAQCPE